VWARNRPYSETGFSNPIAIRPWSAPRPNQHSIPVWDVHFTTGYWLTRLCFQRGLGAIYLLAFLIAAKQFIPLLGTRGLLPVDRLLPHLRFWDAPGIFWINHSDRFMTAIIWCGVALSSTAVTGLSESFGPAVSVTIWFLLWLIYLSLVNVGQAFYGFGWETMLLESGFLAIFLGSSDTRPPAALMWLITWLLFRVMFGAGMIKLRADPCWRDLTCLFYHYETQPSPNPLSRSFHRLPPSVHKAGVVFNHFVELIVPWFYFAPPPLCNVAGAVTILFQLTLIFSGNLSWLNYLTIVLCIPCFDDRCLDRFLSVPSSAPQAMNAPHEVAIAGLVALVIWRSIGPARNLFSARQIMNASFEPLHLVNTYGAFGAVTRQRLEIVISGTHAADPDDSAEWQEYEFKAKPGDPQRPPPFVSPYHYKLDWQMWFLPASLPQLNPWFMRLGLKLLQGDTGILALLGHNPFPGKPPKSIRAECYRYQFTQGEERAGGYWRRSYVRDYLQPMSEADFERAGFRE